MRKDLLIFFLSLIVLSAVLAWIWYSGLQVRYAMLFGPAAKFMFRQLGIHKSGLKFVIEHFTNLVPYIALCASLPGVVLKKRLIRSALGLAILVVFHFIMIVSISAVYSEYSLSRTAYKFMFPILTVNDALPLVLWFLLFSEEILALFRKRRKAADETVKP